MTDCMGCVMFNTTLLFFHQSKVNYYTKRFDSYSATFISGAKKLTYKKSFKYTPGFFAWGGGGGLPLSRGHSAK